MSRIVKRIYNRYSIEEDTGDLVLQKSLVSLNSNQKRPILFPIKIGSLYFFICILDVKDFSLLLSYYNSYTTYKEISEVLSNLKSFIFVDYEYNFVELLEAKDEDFKRFLEPRERQKRLHCDLYRRLKIIKSRSGGEDIKVLLSPKVEKVQFHLQPDFKIFLESEILNLEYPLLNYEDIKSNERDRSSTIKTDFKTLLSTKIDKERYQNLITTFGEDRVKKRLDYELKTISGDKYLEYFHNYISIYEELNKRNIPMILKGSSVGSLLLYLFGLSYINPLKYDISFDRFLGGGKIADIDIDIPSSLRPELLKSLDKELKKSGKSILQILNRSSDKVHNYICHPTGYLIEETKYIEQKLPLLKGEYNLEKDFLQGDIKDDITLYFKTSELYDSSTTPSLEKLGFLKYDLIRSQVLDEFCSYEDELGLKVVDILKNWESYKLDGEYIYRELLKGEYFQLKSEVALKLVKLVKPKSYGDLTKLVALNRPSIIRTFSLSEIGRKIHLGKIDLGDEKINNIINSSNSGSLLLYQEQVLYLLQEVLGNIDFHSALDLVKGRGFKLEDQKELFLQNIKKRNLKYNVGEELWEMILAFGQYGLNKGHSYSYGMFTYLQLIINYLLKKKRGEIK